jgi:hypothetical protein
MLQLKRVFANEKHGESPNLDNCRVTADKCAVSFIELKQSHRSAQMEMQARKEETQREKTKLDELNLKLQNLIYQKNYLQSQIEEAKNFK